MAVRFKRSYHDRKETIARRKKTFIKVLLICFTFQILFSVFFSTIRIDTHSMEPGLDKGNVMVYSPFVYGFKADILNIRLPQVSSPERGDLVVLSPPYGNDKKDAFTVFSSVLEFLTFGKINLNHLRGEKWDSRFLIKRLIAVPGDTVRMSDFKVSIKPQGSSYFLSEFEVIEQDYDIQIDDLPEGWDDSLPFSGNMDTITLEEDQYFLLGDNRLMSSDSLNWGLLDRQRIEGKVIMKYWPLNQIRFFP